MNSLCSDLQGKALQSCCVFCLCSQSRQTVSMCNRGVKVALYRISLMNWRREAVWGVWWMAFHPFTYGEQPTDWDKAEFVSKSPRYRLAAEYKCTELWIFPRFSSSAASACKLPFSSDHLIDLAVFICWLCNAVQNQVILNLFLFPSKSNWTRKARLPFSTTNYLLIDIYIIIIRLTACSATL